MTHPDLLIDKIEARYSKYRDGRDVYALISTVREQAGRIEELEARTSMPVIANCKCGRSTVVEVTTDVMAYEKRIAELEAALKPFAEDGRDVYALIAIVREQTLRIAELEAALEPFANIGRNAMPHDDDTAAVYTILGDCRLAAKALERFTANGETR